MFGRPCRETGSYSANSAFIPDTKSSILIGFLKITGFSSLSAGISAFNSSLLISKAVIKQTLIPLSNFRISLYRSKPFIFGILISMSAKAYNPCLKDDKARGESLKAFTTNPLSSNTKRKVKVISGSSSTNKILLLLLLLLTLFTIGLPHLAYLLNRLVVVVVC